MARLDEEVELLHRDLGGLPRAIQADEILRAIWIDDVHNSTAIEGNTMTRAQVADLLEHQRPSATLVESLEVEGYARAADWVYRTAPEAEGVSTSIVSEIHKLVVGPVWEVEPPPTRDRPGVWRQAAVRFRTLDGSVPVAIQADLDAWSGSAAGKNETHSVTHAAAHHAWLERIHPFVDGNGRVGRLVLNFMLIQYGYPPAVILASERKRYLQALSRADAGNYNSLSEVVARAVSDTLRRFLIPRLAGDAKLVPLSALAVDAPYSADYMRQLVLAGRLRAVREGRSWLSSRAWVADYISTRDPRGGPPRRRRDPY